VIVPETVAPLAGEVMLTMGGVVSALFTVMGIDVLARLAAKSVAVVVTVCPALLAVVVFQEQV
jgi:hypothetical protein